MCVDAFEIDVFVSSVDLGCPGGRTRVLSYNGTMPGASGCTFQRSPGHLHSPLLDAPVLSPSTCEAPGVPFAQCFCANAHSSIGAKPNSVRLRPCPAACTRTYRPMLTPPN